MNILTNTEIADKFGVSNASVTRWIELAQEGKNNLQITKVKNKFRVIDNPHNQAELSRLAEEGRKYRSNVDCKRVKVSDKFYQYFSEEQCIEIFNSLEFKRDVPFKFTYEDGGAIVWDKYYRTDISPLNKSTAELLQSSVNDVLYFIEKYEEVNLIDVGPGNSYPVKYIIPEIRSTKNISKYIGIDISETLMDISKSNINSWYPDLDCRYYKSDIELYRQSKILLENRKSLDGSTNIILHLGNTICNHENRIQVLKNIQSGMLKQDLIVITFTLDNEENRSVLNYVKSKEADLQDTWILNELGVDTDNCEINVKYDDKINAKIKTIRMDKDYVVSTDILGHHKQIELFRGEEITIWKHYLIDEHKFINELNQAGLRFVDLKLDKNYSNALAICKIKKD